MSARNENVAFSGGAFIPLLLIELSVVLGLVWQANFISEQRKMLHINELQLEATVAKVTPQQEEQMRKSLEIQNNLKSFAEALLELAQTDSDAKAIVEKYGIRRN